MSRSHLAAVSVALVTMIGCFDSTGPRDDNLPCTILLTGALTQTVSCGAKLRGHWNGNTDSLNVTVGVTGNPDVAVLLRFKGTPTTGTFSNTDAGARGSVTVTAGTSTWLATTTGMAAGQGAAGSWSMVVETAYELSSTANSIIYVMHGSLDATLPPTSGGGASVTVRINF